MKQIVVFLSLCNEIDDNNAGNYDQLNATTHQIGPAVPCFWDSTFFSRAHLGKTVFENGPLISQILFVVLCSENQAAFAMTCAT